MAYELKPGQGTLFRNDKDGNDKRPDYRGELCLPDGSTLKLAGWVKEGKKGKFLSLSIDRPRDQGADDSFRGSSDRGLSGRDGDLEDAPF
jgi:hypothetical protein